MSAPTPRRVADLLAGLYVGVALGLLDEGRLDLAIVAAVLIVCAVLRVAQEVPDRPVQPDPDPDAWRLARWDDGP